MSLWIEASAGTGKTYFICETIKSNLNKKIVILTHTNAAVEEINKRIGENNNVFVGTIHSFCYRMIESFYNYQISETYKIEKVKNRNRFINYDDIIKIAINIPIEIEIDLLLIDEAQDTSLEQWKVIQRIYETIHPNVIVLGDSKQLIYSFNGSSYEVYMSMKEYFSFNEKTLSKSYRHSSAIIEFLNMEYPGHTTDIIGGHVKETEYKVDKILKNIQNMQSIFLEKYNRYSDKNDILILIDARDYNYKKLCKSLKCRNYVYEIQKLIFYLYFQHIDEYIPDFLKMFALNEDEIEKVMMMKKPISISLKRKYFILSNNSILDENIQMKIIKLVDIMKLEKTIEVLFKIPIDKDIISDLLDEFLRCNPPDLYLFSLFISEKEILDLNVMTIHQSKGLESPIVLFPFCRRTPIFFSHEEYKRMKYVSITRAECFLWINYID